MKVFLCASVLILASVMGAAMSHAAPLYEVLALAGDRSHVTLAAACFVTGLLGVARLAGARR